MRYLLRNDEHQIALRYLDIGDAELLMDLNNDTEIARCVVGNPRSVTLQEQLQWMEKAKSEPNVIRFIVEHRGLAVGTIIISDINRTNLSANMNIKLLKSARGKGIGKQSIKMALKYCFDNLCLVCVTAHVLSYNKASLALFEGCGFTNEGVLRSRVIKNNERYDLISFSILRDEFE